METFKTGLYVDVSLETKDLISKSKESLENIIQLYFSCPDLPPTVQNGLEQLLKRNEFIVEELSRMHSDDVLIPVSTNWKDAMEILIVIGSWFSEVFSPDDDSADLIVPHRDVVFPTRFEVRSGDTVYLDRFLWLLSEEGEQELSHVEEKTIVSVQVEATDRTEKTVNDDWKQIRDLRCDEDGRTLVGREEELEELTKCAKVHRVVGVIGETGSGKSSLIANWVQALDCEILCIFCGNFETNRNGAVDVEISELARLALEVQTRNIPLDVKIARTEIRTEFKKRNQFVLVLRDVTSKRQLVNLISAVDTEHGTIIYSSSQSLLDDEDDLGLPNESVFELHLGPLKRDSACELLTRVCPSLAKGQESLDLLLDSFQSLIPSILVSFGKQVEFRMSASKNSAQSTTDQIRRSFVTVKGERVSLDYPSICERSFVWLEMQQGEKPRWMIKALSILPVNEDVEMKIPMMISEGLNLGGMFCLIQYCVDAGMIQLVSADCHNAWVRINEVQHNQLLAWNTRCFHAALLAAYAKQYKDLRMTRCQYFARNCFRHLKGAENWSKLEELACDGGYILFLYSVLGSIGVASFLHNVGSVRQVNPSVTNWCHSLIEWLDTRTIYLSDDPDKIEKDFGVWWRSKDMEKDEKVAKNFFKSLKKEAKRMNH